MNDLVRIGNSDISIKEYKGQRVVTFKDIDMVHGRLDGTARKRFADNRKHFVENEDFFILKPSDLENTGMSEKRTTGIEEVNPRGTAFITEQGYLMLVKSFTDDLAWDVQRQLVNGYFKKNDAINRSQLSPQMQMVMSLAESMARQELEQKRQAEQIGEVVQTVSNMKEIFTEPIGDWKTEINARVREISMKSGIDYQTLYGEMYGELETTAHCSLKRLQDNKRKRMEDAGNTKTAIKDGTTKIAIIYDKPHLKAIFENIVKKYAMRYCT